MGSGVLVTVVGGGGVSSGALVTVVVSGSEVSDSLEGALVTVVVDGSAGVSSPLQAVRLKAPMRLRAKTGARSVRRRVVITWCLSWSDKHSLKSHPPLLILILSSTQWVSLAETFKSTGSVKQGEGKRIASFERHPRGGVISTGASVARSVVRLVIGGGLGLALTYGAGTLFGGVA